MSEKEPIYQVLQTGVAIGTSITWSHGTPIPNFFSFYFSLTRQLVRQIRHKVGFFKKKTIFLARHIRYLNERKLQ